ncbi:MAG: helix-turn-helix transcriptional regulator [Pseudohongiellaceae bacterium]
MMNPEATVHDERAPVPTMWQDTESLCVDPTGGAPGPFFSDITGGSLPLRTPSNPFAGLTALPARQHALSVPRMLHTVSETFALNRSQLAEACGVTRRGLYDWLEGVLPGRERMERIAGLYRAALDWKRSGFPNDVQPLLKSPVLGQQSLFDLLCEDPLPLDRIHFAGSRLQLREAPEDLEDPFL